jgi:chromate transport protein ChrA
MTDPAMESTKHIIDGLSVVTVIGTLAGILPAVAALLTIVWTAIRIYETETVQGFLRRMKE